MVRKRLLPDLPGLGEDDYFDDFVDYDGEPVFGWMTFYGPCTKNGGTFLIPTRAAAWRGQTTSCATASWRAGFACWPCGSTSACAPSRCTKLHWWQERTQRALCAPGGRAARAARRTYIHTYVQRHQEA